MQLEDLQNGIKENLFINNRLVSKRITKNWFNKHHPSIYISIIQNTSFLDEVNPSFNQRIYHIYYNLFYIPLCKECHINFIKYKSFNKGYGSYCSKKCTNMMRNRIAHENNKDGKITRTKAKEKLENFNPELTEYENMLNNGGNRIGDCGNFVYKYK